MKADSSVEAPICPICEQVMARVSKAKGFFPLPQSETFECKRCAVIATTGEMPVSNDKRNLH